jgi:hypothetical protein
MAVYRDNPGGASYSVEPHRKDDELSSCIERRELQLAQQPLDNFACMSLAKEAKRLRNL